MTKSATLETNYHKSISSDIFNIIGLVTMGMWGAISAPNRNMRNGTLGFQLLFKKNYFYDMNLLDQYSDSIKILCAKYKVSALYAFGSVLGSDFNETSDIDLLVSFKRMDLNAYADNYFNLKFSLEDLFKRSVDLVEETAIKNPYFKSTISNSRQLVYGT